MKNILRFAAKSYPPLMFIGAFFMVMGLLDNDFRLEWGELRTGISLMDRLMGDMTAYFGAFMMALAGVGLKAKIDELEKRLNTLMDKK